VELEFVDDPVDLPAALSRIDEPVVGLDVERADAPRYFRTAALIQVGTAERVVLVDAVRLAPVPTLSDFLAERTSILHALQNDLEPMRAVGVEVGDVHDTAIAASLLGLPTGLDPLLQELLGLALSPDKERFQRADWEQRPLPDDMADYAAMDVIHLSALWTDLRTRLQEDNRLDWYQQELHALVDGAYDDTRDWTRTKGAGRLSPEERAVLKALWEEREAICIEADLAPNRVLRDEVLIDLAQNPARDPADLIRRNRRRGRPGRGHAERLHAAQESGKQAPPEPKENGAEPWSRAHRDAFDAMRKTRAAIADDLGLDAGVLCPSRALWGPARGNPSDPDELCALADLRPWQAAALGDVLWDAYRAAMADHADDPA
jgi:ribonuclease D